MDIDGIINKIDEVVDTIPDKVNDIAYVVMDHFNLIMMIAVSIVCLCVFAFLFRLANEIVPKDCSDER